MTDEMLALARENQRKAGRRERRVAPRADRGDPAARRDRRRRDLQLRDQPLRRQARGAGARRPASCSPAGASPSPTSSPTRTWTRRPAPTWQQWTGCIAGALTRARVRAGARRRRPRGHRDQRDPPRARARRLGDHPRPQAGEPRERRTRSSSTTPQTLYRRWEDAQWSPFDDRPRPRHGAVGADGRRGPRA